MRHPLRLAVALSLAACRSTPPPPAPAPVVAPPVVAACSAEGALAPHADDAPAPAPAAGAAVIRACGLVTEATRRRLTPLFAAVARERATTLLAPLVRCYGAAEGAWAFAVARAVRVPLPDAGGYTTEVDVRPVYVSADGRQRPGATLLRLTTSTARFAELVSVADVGVFDWDGDGRAELYFREGHEQEENGNEVGRRERWWTFAARGTAAPTEFAPEAARAVRVADVDGDQRPDLVLRSPWVAVGPCGIGDVDFPGPMLLLHSLRGGDFSGDDAAAHGYVARQCRERPARLIEGDPDNDHPADQAGYRVACARWWGRSAAQVAAEINRTYPPTPDGGDPPLRCFPQEELLRLAAIDPPQEFRLRCAAP